MPLYELKDESIAPLTRTTFAAQDIRERQDLQRLLRAQIELIAPDIMVIAEEFGQWDESRRRIDLLCLDKNMNLVVVELKRTEDGGHMDLQALRYSSMVSTMTFNQVVDAHQSFLDDINLDEDAETRIIKFFDGEEPDEENFAQSVRIILASAEFSKELTSSVLWLNDQGLDITCVKIEPYDDQGRTLLDIQQVIPLPEAAQYQIQVRKKKQQQQSSRVDNRDYSKFTLQFGEERLEHLAKRNLAYELISRLIAGGASADQIEDVVSDVKRVPIFERHEGILGEEDFRALIMERDRGGRKPRTSRFFCNEDQLMHYGNTTLALTNQWGIETEEMCALLLEAFDDQTILIEKEV